MLKASDFGSSNAIFLFVSGEDLKLESLVTETVDEADLENCENVPPAPETCENIPAATEKVQVMSPAHETQPSVPTPAPEVPDEVEMQPEMPETVAEEQPSLVPPSRPKKRSFPDSDLCTPSVVGRACTSEDDHSKRKKAKKYSMKCGEEHCSFRCEGKVAMIEHLISHMPTYCEKCHDKFRGPVDEDIHRVVFKKHASSIKPFNQTELLAAMSKRVIKEKKNAKKGDFVCHLEIYDDENGTFTYMSVQYSTLIYTQQLKDEFSPFVDMTYKNASVKPIAWKRKVKRYSGNKKSEISLRNE